MRNQIARQRNVLRLLLSTVLVLSFGTNASAVQLPEIAIHAGDKVRLTVYNHPDLSTDTTVDGSGQIAVPDVGSVTVEGLNPSAAAFTIGRALQPVLRHPSVSVTVLEQTPLIFFTGSQIGVQPYQAGETLTAAMGSLSTKGTDSFAASAIDLRSVRLERDGRIVGDYDLQELGRLGDPGPRLQSADVIEVANKPIRVNVGGIVKTPGPVYLYQGNILAQAVEEAGGFGPTASLTDIVLQRDGATSIVSAAGPALTAPAQDGDTITIKPAPRVNVLGMVSTSGNFPLQGNPTLLYALYLAGGPNKWADVRHIKVVHQGVTSEHDINGLTHGDLSENVALQDGDIVFVPEGHRIDPSPFLTALGVAATIRWLVP
jgi:polysaccharide export outer membrane protein